MHGTGDVDVPWTLSERLMRSMQSTDAQLLLVKDANHRFSEPDELDLIKATLLELLKA